VKLSHPPTCYQHTVTIQILALLLFTEKNVIPQKAVTLAGFLGCQFYDIRFVFRYCKNFHCLAFVLCCYCQIPGCGGNILVSEDFFERVQVPAVHQKMRSKRMTKVMKPHVIYPCPFQRTPPTSF
jgi:hypothetical protein